MPAVTVGAVVPALPTSGQVVQPPYDTYAVTVGYEWDNGVACMPVAGPPGTPAHPVRLHAGACIKVVTWMATRIGAVPIVPAVDTSNPNEVFLDRAIGLPSPGIDMGDNQVWTLTGRYRYQLLVPPALADQLQTGHIPHDLATAESNYLPPAAFDQSVLGTPPPVTGGATGNVDFTKPL